MLLNENSEKLLHALLITHLPTPGRRRAGISRNDYTDLWVFSEISKIKVDLKNILFKMVRPIEIFLCLNPSKVFLKVSQGNDEKIEARDCKLIQNLLTLLKFHNRIYRGDKDEEF